MTLKRFEKMTDKQKQEWAIDVLGGWKDIYKDALTIEEVK